MFDLIIRNGTVISANTTSLADIAIKDSKIAAISEPGLLDKARRVVDASGKYVLPGIIDPHCHIHASVNGIYDTLDFFTASRCAAYGGVTTLLDFSESQKGGSVLAAVKARREEMQAAAIDFGIHAKFIEASPGNIQEIKDIVAYGCPSFKLFMTYRKAGVMIEDEDILKVLGEASNCGALPGFHAESNAIVEYCTDKLSSEGNVGWDSFPLSRPSICEMEAVNRILAYSQFLDCPVYFFHISTGMAKDAIYKAQKAGARVFAETCPHYLTLTEDVYKTADGHLHMMSPPLRRQGDQEKLWEGMTDGTLTIIGSDNCTFTREIKEQNLERNKDGSVKPDFTKVISGCCGIEERLGLLIAEGINKGRITWNQLVNLTSLNPAKTFGLYPQKGAIQVGFDADIVIIDPEKEVTISDETLHYGIGYSIYEGITPKGWPVMTIRRGDILVEDGEFLGQRGTGQFIRRKLSL